MHKPGNERIQQAKPQPPQGPVPTAAKTPGFGKVGIPAVAAVLCVRASHAKMLARKGAAGR
jgi:hypothetical protein